LKQSGSLCERRFSLSKPGGDENASGKSCLRQRADFSPHVPHCLRRGIRRRRKLRLM
jgi:hypothetical protein